MSDEPLVLLHPFAVTRETWRPVLPALEARFDVTAPTLPGHAGGPAYSGAFTFGRFADAVERQLDDLGIGTAHLVGNSTGGALAIELAKRGRARSVVALSPGSGWAPGSLDPRRIALAFAAVKPVICAADPHLERILARPRSRRLALAACMRHGDRLSPTEAARFFRAAMRCTVFDAMIALLRADGMHLEDLDRVTAPVLLAWAEHDRMVPARTCAGRLRREIPGAAYTVLRGVGHLPTWDDPRLVAATIVEWVSAHRRVAAAA